MKKVMMLVKRIVMSFFVLYGYNLIAANFNMVIPINIIINNKIPNNKTFIFDTKLEIAPNMNDNKKVSINIIGIQLSFFILSPYFFMFYMVYYKLILRLRSSWVSLFPTLGYPPAISI